MGFDKKRSEKRTGNEAKNEAEDWQAQMRPFARRKTQADGRAVSPFNFDKQLGSSGLLRSKADNSGPCSAAMFVVGCEA
jgi:hypothetical protein